jgi:class 3 adenylate cyclase
VDDPRRAVSAAVALVEALKLMGPHVHCAVGVTTGTAFCGVVGSRTRREYTVSARVCVFVA